MTTDKQQLQARAREVELLAQASRTLNASLEFGELLGGLLKIVKTAMRAEVVLVSVIDESGTRLIFERALGIDDKELRGSAIAKSSGVMGWVWDRREPLILNDPKARGEIVFNVEKKLGLKVQQLVAIPLMRRGTVRGVLEVINRKNEEPFGDDDVALLIPLGEHVAVAVANARLRAEANRRRLEYSLLAEVSADVGKSLTRDEALERILKNSEARGRLRRSGDLSDRPQDRLDHQRSAQRLPAQRHRAHPRQDGRGAGGCGGQDQDRHHRAGRAQSPQLPQSSRPHALGAGGADAHARQRAGIVQPRERPVGRLLGERPALAGSVRVGSGGGHRARATCTKSAR